MTAAIQFVAALILASIALLVRSERPPAAATSPDDDGDETASRTSSGGYSLLDFDDTLRLDTPPHEMTDAQIDELLSATTDLVTPTKLRPVSEGDETGEEAPPRGTQYTTL